MAQVKVIITDDEGQELGTHAYQLAQRQKRKGLSWSKQGSLNLALVTANLPPLPTTRTVYLQ